MSANEEYGYPYHRPETKSRELPAPSLRPPHPPPIPPEKINVKALWEKLLYHWRENRVAKRLGKKVYPRALIVSLVVGGSTFINGLLFGQNPATQTAPFTISPTMIASGFFGLLLVALFFAFPIFFAGWAYRETFTSDENIQTAPLTFEDRLMGILVPGIGAIIIYQAVTSVLGVLTTILTWGTEPMMEGALLLLTTVIVMIPQSILYTFTYTLLFATVLVRRLIQHPKIGQRLDKTKGYVAVPYLLYVALYIAFGCVVGIASFGFIMLFLAPQFAGGGAGGGGPAPAGNMQSTMIMSQLIALLGAIGTTWIYYIILKGWWIWDISLARSVLFENQKELTAGGE